MTEPPNTGCKPLVNDYTREFDYASEATDHDVRRGSFSNPLVEMATATETRWGGTAKDGIRASSYSFRRSLRVARMTASSVRSTLMPRERFFLLVLDAQTLTGVGCTEASHAIPEGLYGRCDRQLQERA